MPIGAGFARVGPFAKCESRQEPTQAEPACVGHCIFFVASEMQVYSCLLRAKCRSILAFQAQGTN